MPNTSLSPIAVMAREAARTKPSELYVPTGIIEPIIKMVGEGRHRIVAAPLPNGVGKTRLNAEISRELCVPSGNEYFDYPIFKKWPFAKKIYIIGTPENLSEGGIVEQHLKNALPVGSYEAHKDGKRYFRRYVFSRTGWTIRLLTYEQAVTEYEGDELGLLINDEPCLGWMVDALRRGMRIGGIWLSIFTPWPLGKGFENIDHIETLEAMGESVGRPWPNGVSFRDNDKDTGLMNSKGAKRGLLSKEVLDGHEKQYKDPSMRAARLEGKTTTRLGRVYPQFHDRHKVQIKLDSNFVRSMNIYQSLDIHPKLYPFAQWWGIAPNLRAYLLWEWPDYDWFGDFYDNIRNERIFDGTEKTLVEIFKNIETELGFNVLGRWLDPRRAVQSKGEIGKPAGLLQAFNLEFHPRVGFELPPFERIYLQRNKIRDLLNFDMTQTITPFNSPQMFFNVECRNTCRAFEKGFFIDEKETEDEIYKDPRDCARIFLGGYFDRVQSETLVYIDPLEKKAKERVKIEPSHYHKLFRRQGL